MKVLIVNVHKNVFNLFNHYLFICLFEYCSYLSLIIMTNMESAFNALKSLKCI